MAASYIVFIEGLVSRFERVCFLADPAFLLKKIDQRARELPNKAVPQDGS